MEKITSNKLLDINELNIDIAFIVVGAGFLSLGEIIYSDIECKKPFFSKIKVTKSNIFFAEGNQYGVLNPKQFENNTKHTGIQIILATTEQKIYLMTALAHFHTWDP